MGQSLRINVEPRYRKDEIPYNGEILGDVYLPNEIIVLILSYVKTKYLVSNCLYVCHKWRELIQNDVWKLKAEREYPHRLKSIKGCGILPDLIYQGICCKDAYNRNLLKNNSGQTGLRYWEFMLNDGDGWTTEIPPVGVTRPSNAIYQEPKHCFVSSYGLCKKQQIVDLQKCGVHPSVLDVYQPEIIVSEWCAARWDCGSQYELEVDLLGEGLKVLQSYSSNIVEMRDWTNGWQEIKHTFKDYGAGVRYIVFSHSGKDLRYWAGHFGSKMANAQVLVNISKKIFAMVQSLRSEELRKSVLSMEPRVLKDEIPYNGVILNSIHLPNKIIVLILSYVRCKDLVGNCLYVCHKWRELIQSDVWKLKAEREHPHRIKYMKDCGILRDLIYQGICCKDAYNRNLLKNNSGQSRFGYWEITENEGDFWIVETPPLEVTRPPNAIYQEPEYCFVSSYGLCKKQQIVDLKKCGVNPSVMDLYQPEIIVSEWCAARWDCESQYELEVTLLGGGGEVLQYFSSNIVEMRDWTNGWQEIKHTFKDYGVGVRYIVFSHSGKDLRYWAGHFGSKMANAQVVVNISKKCF